MPYMALLLLYYRRLILQVRVGISPNLVTYHVVLGTCEKAKNATAAFEIFEQVLYWYKCTGFTGTKVLILLVQK
jgi:hypothetical protein